VGRKRASGRRCRHGTGSDPSDDGVDDHSRIGEILANPCLDEPDDQFLGHKHEGRLRIAGRIGTRVLVLIAEPVELEEGEVAARSIARGNATWSAERHCRRRHR
jgi:hypothetical protein